MAVAGASFPTELHPEAFEATIERHGQYVRWYSSLPCSCIDNMTRVNPRCTECKGRGFLYYPIKERRRLETVFSYGCNSITVSGNIKEIFRVQRATGEEINYTSFTSSTIKLASALSSGQYCVVDYMENLEASFEGAAVWKGFGVVQASLPAEVVSEGVFVGLITEVTQLYNVTKDKPIQVLSFWEDKLLIADTPDSTDILQITCKYIKPIKFLIVSVKGREERGHVGRSRALRDERIAAFQDFDATLTFPGYVRVGSGDLLTLLKAEQQTTAVGAYTANTYQLPFFHVRSVVRIQDKHGQIGDVAIIRNNELQFNGREPDGKFSLSYTYVPTFVVSGETPSLRYGENKAFPKVVGLKRFDSTSRKELPNKINNITMFGRIEGV